MSLHAKRKSRAPTFEDKISHLITSQKELYSLIDSVANNTNRKKDHLINYLFLTILIVIFGVEITTDLLPPLLSLEIGILLVSIKIIWMIHMQSRFQHFTFLLLNTIEQKLKLLEKHIHTQNSTDETLDASSPEARQEKHQNSE